MGFSEAAELERRLQRQVVHLGGDLRKYQQGSGEWGQTGKVAGGGCVIQLVITVGNCSSFIPFILGTSKAV